jgi:hypothetical protein
MLAKIARFNCRAGVGCYSLWAESRERGDVERG